MDLLWQRIRKSFAFYGKKTRQNLGPQRRELLKMRLKEGFTEDELVMAIDGYLWANGGFDTEFSNGLTSGHYFRFETVFKAKGFEDRVERGAAGSWVSPKRVSRAVEREEKARKESEEYRALVMKERRLRAV